MFNKAYFKASYYKDYYFKPRKVYILPPSYTGGYGGSTVRDKLIHSVNILSAISLSCNFKHTVSYQIINKSDIGIDSSLEGYINDPNKEKREEDNLILLTINNIISGIDK